MGTSKIQEFYAERFGRDSLVTSASAPPLNIDQRLTLPSLCEASHNDGFGEGFEQREIKTGNNELYVSLWSHENSFRIMTGDEFQQQLAPEQTPGLTQSM